MEQLSSPDFINREELIYWIDKYFVQETAKSRIGRNLNDDELEKFTKLIEFGLWDTVYDTVKIAIDEVNRK
jgi:hypothetical protein